jgi:hypothetical protein
MCDCQPWAASSPVTCRHDCGLLSREAVFRSADRGLQSWLAIFDMPVSAYRPAAPAHRARSKRLSGPGSPACCELSRSAGRCARLRRSSRGLSQAQAQFPRAEPARAQIREAEPSAFPAQPGDASTAQRGTPRAPAPAPSPCRQPARAAAAPYRQARSTAARLRRQRGTPPPEPRFRPMHAHNNSGQYPLTPAGVNPLLSRADLLPDCYQEALPSTPNHSYLYSNCSREQSGATETRTPTSCMP